MKAAIYARQSKDPGAGESSTTEDQVARATAYAQSQGWTVVGTYADTPGTPYRSWNQRAALKEALASGADVLVVQEPSRLFRVTGKTGRERRQDKRVSLDLQDRSEDAGVRYWATADGKPLLDLQMADEDALFMWSVGEYADAKAAGAKSEKTRDAIRREAKRGRYNGGRYAPFGYVWARDERGNEDRTMLAIDPTTAPLVREAAERALAGESTNAIARDWTERQVAGRERWHRSTVHRLLSNPAVAAIRQYQPTEQVPEEERGAGTRVYSRPVGPVEEYDGAWTPILDRATWRRLQKALAQRGKRTKEHRGTGVQVGIRLASGHVRCAECGGRMQVDRGRRGAEYRCRKRPGHVNCGQVQASANAVDRVLAERLHVVLEGEGLEAKRQELRADPGAYVEAEEALAAVETRREELAQAFASGALAMATFKMATAALDAQDREARAALEAADESASAALESVGPDFAKWWQNASAGERQEIFRTLAEYVEIGRNRKRGVFDPERVRVVWKA